MLDSPKLFADQYLEIISLMGKRFVQNEWPSLIPVHTSSINFTIGTYLILLLVRQPIIYKVLFGGNQKDLQEVQIHVQIRCTLQGNELYD